MDAREKISSRPRHGSEAPKSPETAKPSELKEVKSKASEVLKSNESAEGAEGVELSEGKVSESVSDNQEQASQGGGTQQLSTDQIEAIRAKLLAALPPQEVMIKQIKKKLAVEENHLHKKRKKLMKNSHKNAFEMTLIVRQLRKIQEYFYVLAHATYELVKHLWLKIVHGV